jgi:hypothetical protein
MEQLTFKIFFFTKFEKLSAAAVFAAAKKGVQKREIFLYTSFSYSKF